jgi:hypothetical protein
MCGIAAFCSILFAESSFVVELVSVVDAMTLMFFSVNEIIEHEIGVQRSFFVIS